MALLGHVIGGIAQKMSKYGVFSGPYFPVFSPKNTDQKILCIWILFTQGECLLITRLGHVVG